MKNIEKYKDIVLDNMNICDIHIVLRRKCNKESRAFCEGFNCQGCKERFLNWLLEEVNEPVLDDAERKYLSEVIRPFRKKITYISKVIHCGVDRQYISIKIKDKDGFRDSLNLPDFENDTMYKGMEINKAYTLEELGL